MKKIISGHDLAQIVNEIKKHGNDLVIAAERPDPKYFACNDGQLSSLVSIELGEVFSDLDQDDIDMICEAISIILEGALIELKYFKDKDERDALIQNQLSPEAQEVVKHSITRATNMRNVYSVIEALIPNEFDTFIHSAKEMYLLQLKSKDYSFRIQNAKDFRALTSKLCLSIVGKYPRL